MNIDSLPVTAYSAVYESVGLDALSFAPTSASLASSAWPSLGEMIDSGKRVVTFGGGLDGLVEGRGARSLRTG